MNSNFEEFQEDISSKEHAVNKMMKAIALEEEALSKLMNTEADKTLAFVGKNLDFPTDPSTLEIIQFNHTVIQLLDTMLMSKWILFKKMDMIAHLEEMTPSLRTKKHTDGFDF